MKYKAKKTRGVGVMAETAYRRELKNSNIDLVPNIVVSAEKRQKTVRECMEPDSYWERNYYYPIIKDMTMGEAQDFLSSEGKRLESLSTFEFLCDHIKKSLKRKKKK